MTEALGERIIAFVEERPGQKAEAIARGLGCSTQEVNQAFYGPLSGRIRQDNSYRWFPAESVRQTGWGRTNPADRQGADAPQFAKTSLARIIRYYLDCIGHDDAGVSTLLTSPHDDVDYAELAELPASPTALADSEAARYLLGRKRTERARYGLYLGYPTAVTRARSQRSGTPGLMVEPILLFQVEQDPVTQRLTIDLAAPIVNQKPLRSLTNASPDTILNEVAELEEDLGLAGDQALPELDDLAMRLQALRPEWPWRERIIPDTLGTHDFALPAITEPGIYNRAILIMAEKSPFTQGLELELRALARLPEVNYADSALGDWLRASERRPVEPTTLPGPLLEVLPMNSEQREAVTAALTRPLTIITGPPGTGKSQVVSNLLVNAAWAGKRVLFASKNNKAVDVVETRVNALGPRPVLLRVGAKAYQAKLAEYVLALLSTTATKADSEAFEEAKEIHERLLREYRQLDAERSAFIQTRNTVDRLEQQAEEARSRLPPALFSRAAGYGASEAAAALTNLDAAVDRADRMQASLFVRLFWRFARRDRLEALGAAFGAARTPLTELGGSLEGLYPREADIPGIRAACARARKALADVEAAAAYRRHLKELQGARPLEEIAHCEAGLLNRIAENSKSLWQQWLRLQPTRLSQADRLKFGKYTTVLRMIIEARGSEAVPRGVMAEYRKLLSEAAHLLPCWAVTSLSAQGRIPFEPGYFDLVIFDEASQCDIASALPLLYRAKAVVVIGDPQQLAHISGLHQGQDQALLVKHSLIAEFPEWAYSYQSLFGLAASRVVGDDLISLVDHHRSHADIIDFSNKEFYEGRLRVATRYDRLRRPNPREPGVRWVDVRSRTSRPTSGSAVNRTEAQAVVELLRDLMLRKRYAGTIGVVTPFRAQANAITEAVNRDDALAAALIRSEFLADTVHKFQGDERDVIVFSPVVAEDCPDSALTFMQKTPNLFNVAITRARAQVVVVGDRQACQQSGVGHLSRFADYAVTLSIEERRREDREQAELGPVYPHVARPELVSEWERVLYGTLYERGIRPIPQYQVEKYTLDFLVTSGDSRLALEVDGERYHRNWNGELCRRDQIRNQRLFELGYDVMRFWVYEIRDDMEGCITRVQRWVAGTE